MMNGIKETESLSIASDEETQSILKARELFGGKKEWAKRMSNLFIYPNTGRGQGVKGPRMSVL